MEVSTHDHCYLVAHPTGVCMINGWVTLSVPAFESSWGQLVN